MLQQPHYRLPKLLIVYASYGDGHIQAAKALSDAYADYGDAMQQVVMYDLMAEAHPWINEMTRRFYQKSYTHLPYLYGWMYDITKPMKPNSLFGSWLHSFGRQKIRQLLDKVKPDAVVYTFPLYALQGVQKKQGSRIPSYVVMTDFDLHCRWVHPSIDRYYVATPDLRAELRQLDIPHNKIKVTGIPLKKGFHQAQPSPELYAKYRLAHGKPTVLIMAGAQGMLPHITELCDATLARSPDIQIALVCGRNDELKSAMDNSIASHFAPRLRTFGYVTEIHELMALADCLVTKPGGITLAEAISAGLPAFIYRPVPGQEKRNALYLQSKGAAFVASELNSLVDQILELVHDPLRLMNSRLHIRRLQPKANPSSGTAAQAIILDIVSNSRIINHASHF